MPQSTSPGSRDGLPSLRGHPSHEKKRKSNAYSLGPSDRSSKLVHEAQQFAATVVSSTAAHPLGISRDGRCHPHASATQVSSSRNVNKGSMHMIHRTQQALRMDDGSLKEECGTQLVRYNTTLVGTADVKDEQWRSSLLQCEADLRELVVAGVNAPPSSSRMAQVLRIFDSVCRSTEEHSAHLAQMLRLFRVEFCRAIFSTKTTESDQASTNQSLEEDFPTYFDEVISLRRENVILNAEIGLGNTGEKMASLTKKMEKLNDKIALYELAITRLTRQNDMTVEQCRKLQDELAEVRTKTGAQLSAAERDLHKLNTENKDLHLQLFQLRKQVSGGKTKILKDVYQQLKLSKMNMMATLFSEGDERVILLIMHSQLEMRINEILDTFDNEFVLTAESSQTELRQSMCSRVAVLLEEMHLCERNYRRLVPCRDHDVTSEDIDETDGFAAILFEQKIYESFCAREVIRKHLMGTSAEQPVDTNMSTASVLLTGDATDTPQAALHPHNDSRMNEFIMDLPPVLPSGASASGQRVLNSCANTTSISMPMVWKPSSAGGEASRTYTPVRVGNGFHRSEALGPEEFVFQKKAEWVNRIFSMTQADVVLSKCNLPTTAIRQKPGVIPSNVLLPRLLRHPLLELSSERMFNGLEVFHGRDPEIHKFLCSVNYVDPSVPIALPENTNFIKIKYKNSLRESELVAEEGGAVLNDPPVASRRGPKRKASSHRQWATKSKLISNVTSSLHDVRGVANIDVDKQLQEWGGKSAFKCGIGADTDADDAVIFDLHEPLRVFRELGSKGALKDDIQKQRSFGGISSSTASTVAFKRMNPLSPDRAPEWSLYQSLFGGYRSLTPRMIELVTIDHILMCAVLRHFTRMEFRFQHCKRVAEQQATNSQMVMLFTERFFLEAYELTDFQESLVDELEARYCFPELVAKVLYEVLCFLDAVGPSNPLLDLYLNVIRGFKSPTRIHYMCFMLFKLSYSWPSSDTSTEVSKSDLIAVLHYLYTDTENITHVDTNEVLRDFEMSTRGAPITLTTVRNFMIATMLHFEEPLLMYFKGLFASSSSEGNCNELTFNSYEEVMERYWPEKVEGKSLIRFLTASLGLKKGTVLAPEDVACVATSMWCTRLLS